MLNHCPYLRGQQAALCCGCCERPARSDTVRHGTQGVGTLQGSHSDEVVLGDWVPGTGCAAATVTASERGKWTYITVLPMGSSQWHYRSIAGRPIRGDAPDYLWRCAALARNTGKKRHRSFSYFFPSISLDICDGREMDGELSAAERRTRAHTPASPIPVRCGHSNAIERAASAAATP